MKLQVLIDLSLMLVLASGSKDQDWNITVPESINATLGSDVTIKCTFDYPKKYSNDSVQVYWKMKVASNITINDQDKNAFICHTNDSFVLTEYRRRTHLIRDESNKSCSVKILNVRHNISDIYVRIVLTTEKYSFKKHLVSIFVLDEDSSPTLYVVAAVPASAVLIIIIIVSGCLCYRKRRRSKSITREESGYYANFSRAPSNPVHSEATCKTHDNRKHPEPKVIDESVYVNTEAITAQMGQRLDHREVIYENVNCSK
ncbi:sialic acid-binding Ig-like lectin 12 isoform X2 [Betta splendens]|nr:sialic acid-binding Ig-like lectin 12 isoform X2 [Betta splendens]